MDLVSILKDKGIPLARFAQKQLMVWLSVVRYPLAVVSKVDLRSSKGVTPALRFVVFVYALTLLVAIPKMFLYQNVAVSSGVVILTDFVATALGFCLVGLTLYAAGKLMGGRGRLLASMIAGLYLTALWPIVQVTDYILSPELPPALGPHGTMIVRAALFAVVVVFVVVFIVVKASPVMGHVHAIGRVRATIAVLVQGFLMFVGLFLFLRPLFEKLAGKQ
jgi:hypothetical protein